MSGSKTVVTAEIQLELLTVDGAGIGLHTTWSYDPQDPLAVRIDFLLPFGMGESWGFARTLLAEGLNAPAGEGDVLFDPETDGLHVLMMLRAPDGAAVFRAPASELRAFLGRTLARLPLGAEQCGAALELWLHAVLDAA
ncbi:SsgA family sporulation/cell division regulator [Kitasatospora nipponensis]|uniref:SsgA family sporulation/cell division regulator n=1 Tax=Kitasatospora nipponensis TaxID=258049 RepID=A0ABP4GY24_9ACTN